MPASMDERGPANVAAAERVSQSAGQQSRTAGKRSPSRLLNAQGWLSVAEEIKALSTRLLLQHASHSTGKQRV